MQSNGRKKKQETSVIQTKCKQMHASGPVVTAKCAILFLFFCFIHLFEPLATASFYFDFICNASIASQEMRWKCSRRQKSEIKATEPYLALSVHLNTDPIVNLFIIIECKIRQTSFNTYMNINEI